MIMWFILAPTIYLALLALPIIARSGSAVLPVLCGCSIECILQGLDASLVGVIPYAAVRLAMYDGLKHLYTKVRSCRASEVGAPKVFGPSSTDGLVQIAY